MNHRSKTFSFYFFVHGQSLYGKERLDSALFPPKEAIEDWILKIQEEDTFEDYKSFTECGFPFRLLYLCCEFLKIHEHCVLC